MNVFIYQKTQQISPKLTSLSLFRNIFYLTYWKSNWGVLQWSTFGKLYYTSKGVMCLCRRYYTQEYFWTSLVVFLNAFMKDYSVLDYSTMEVLLWEKLVGVLLRRQECSVPSSQLLQSLVFLKTLYLRCLITKHSVCVLVHHLFNVVERFSPVYDITCHDIL